MSKTRITNTTAMALGDPIMGLMMAMPSMLEADERRGQTEVVDSESLPANMTNERPQFEALGFVFGAPDPSDKLFLSATLPAGWVKRGTEHPMCSEIVDEKGRKRVEVFYKAAFYDREAFMRLCSRYNIRTEYNRPAYDSVYAYVTDGGTEIYRTRTVTGTDRECFAAGDGALRVEAKAWLASHNSQWNDPVKQWEK